MVTKIQGPPVAPYRAGQSCLRQALACQRPLPLDCGDEPELDEDEHSETGDDARDSNWNPEGESDSDHSTAGAKNLLGNVPRKSRQESNALTQPRGARPRRCLLHGCRLTCQTFVGTCAVIRTECPK